MQMKKLNLLFMGTMLLAACLDNENKTEKMETTKAEKIEVSYPETEKIEVSDTFFGKEIIDPYRWLEDDRSDKTAAWVKAQNEVTFGYLNKIPYREELKNKLEKVFNYERLSAPFKRGNYTYYYKNDGLQDQSILYRKGTDEEEEVFLDPNEFTEDGTTSLGGVSFTKDGSLVAYSISEGGSDWRKVIVMDAASKNILEDTLVDVKFSGISWRNNAGFYYSSYEKPEGSELSAKTDQHILYYHKLGTAQNTDLVIFGKKASEKHRYVGGNVTEDGRYLLVSGANSTYGNKLFIKDLENESAGFKTILNHENSSTYVAENEGNKLFIYTDLDAPNYRLVTVNAENPTAENWVDFIAEEENVLSISSGGGYLFAQYMVDALSKVVQYDFDGKKVREVKLPGLGTASEFGSKKEEKEMYFSFTNYKTPGTTFKYNVESGEYEKYWSPKIDFNPDNYVSEQVFYTSKDGTKVPMMITHKKGIELNGKNPTILYGYGGFNVSLTPSFSTTNAIWMELGGIYAVPNLRGGGEYGKEWHVAGTKQQKQNVFDDFIAAAEYLKEKNYTSTDYLAIRGGSNGGLLVGAVMTQRPDLIKVALPAVGVLDMLRYHTFTAGAGWAFDYGTAEDNKEMFEYLLGYSPVHNVKEGSSYPATMVTTGDHDDRVVPAHSFKFAAELQDKHVGENPVLIRIETNAGHGAGTPISKTIEQSADMIGFTLYNMGIGSLDY